MPRLPSEYATWMGRLSSCENFAEKYGVDEVRYVDEVSAKSNRSKIQCTCNLTNEWFSFMSLLID